MSSLATTLILVLAAAAASPRDVLLVTGAQPLDPERLADAVRAYLDDVGLEVQTAPPISEQDLRSELDAIRRTGEQARALAVVRIAPGAAGTADIELVDRVTGKALVTTVPRPPRDEDFYRAVALKIRALLRSTLSESPGLATERPALAPLVAAAPSPDRATQEGRRTGLEVGYALVGFPAGSALQQGIAVSGTLGLTRRVDAVLRVAVGSALDRRAGEVSVFASNVPLWLGAEAHGRAGRVEGAAGPGTTLLVIHVDPSSSTEPVRGGWFLVPGLGVAATGRVFVTPRLWLYARLTAAALLVQRRFTVAGDPVLDLSRAVVDAGAGLGAALW